MVEKYIELIRHQIEKLNEDPFDLEAWKKATTVLLARIFGDASTKISEIEKIRFDYGSWSLRDASGSSDQMDSCKNQGKVVLEACIAELEIVGLEEEVQEDSTADSAVIECIEQELKMSEYKELIKILKTKSSGDDKKQMLVHKLQSFDTDTPPRIVANILTHPAFKKYFK
jgi:hypothetical protein